MPTTTSPTRYDGKLLMDGPIGVLKVHSEGQLIFWPHREVEVLISDLLAIVACYANLLDREINLPITGYNNYFCPVAPGVDLPVAQSRYWEACRELQCG
jgi:hypothetical protein